MENGHGTCFGRLEPGPASAVNAEEVSANAT
jgi:hypothetical protein